MGACCSNPVTKPEESTKVPLNHPKNDGLMSEDILPRNQFTLYDEPCHPKCIPITRELLTDAGCSPSVAKLIIDFWWEPVLGFAVEKIKPVCRDKDQSMEMMETFYVHLDKSESTDGVERCFAYKGPARDFNTEEDSYDLFLMPQRYHHLVGLAGDLLSHASKTVLDEGLPIIVTECTAHVMPYVITYLLHHNNIEPAAIAMPIRSCIMTEVVEDKWDARFINSIRKKHLFELILAANTMQIISLLHLGSAKVATAIKGSPERIKEILSEGNDEEWDKIAN